MGEATSISFWCARMRMPRRIYNTDGGDDAEACIDHSFAGAAEYWRKHKLSRPLPDRSDLVPTMVHTLRSSSDLPPTPIFRPR